MPTFDANVAERLTAAVHERRDVLDRQVVQARQTCRSWLRRASPSHRSRETGVMASGSVSPSKFEVPSSKFPPRERGLVGPRGIDLTQTAISRWFPAA